MGRTGVGRVSGGGGGSTIEFFKCTRSFLFSN